jgi:hypothetical protein
MLNNVTRRSRDVQSSTIEVCNVERNSGEGINQRDVLLDDEVDTVPNEK